MANRKIRLKPSVLNKDGILPNGLTDEQRRGEFEVLVEEVSSYNTQYLFLKVDSPYGVTLNIDGAVHRGWWILGTDCES